MPEICGIDRVKYKNINYRIQNAIPWESLDSRAQVQQKLHKEQ